MTARRTAAIGGSLAAAATVIAVLAAGIGPSPLASEAPIPAEPVPAKDIPSASDHAYEGSMLLIQGRHAQALGAFDAAIMADIQYADAHTGRGITLYGLGMYDEALASLDYSLGLDPKQAGVHASRGAVLLGLGQHEEAIKAYEMSLELDMQSADAHAGMAVVMYEMKRYGEAIAGYDKALRLDPNYPDAEAGRMAAMAEKRIIDEEARALEEQRDVPEQDDPLKAALDAETKEQDSTGQEAQGMQDDPPSIEAEAETKEPDSTGQEAQGMQDDPPSIEAEVEAEPKAPPPKSDYEYAVEHAKKGAALYGQDKYMKALEAYEEAIRLSPEYGEAHYGMGQVLHTLGRYGDALDSLDRAIDSDPKSKHMHALRGDALTRLGHNVDALEAYTISGGALDEMGRYEESLDAFDKAIKLDPNMGFAHAGRGKALAELGKYEDARESFSAASVLEPGSVAKRIGANASSYNPIEPYDYAAIFETYIFGLINDKRAEKDLAALRFDHGVKDIIVLFNTERNEMDSNDESISGLLDKILQENRYECRKDYGEYYREGFYTHSWYYSISNTESSIEIKSPSRAATDAMDTIAYGSSLEIITDVKNDRVGMDALLVGDGDILYTYGIC